MSDENIFTIMTAIIAAADRARFRIVRLVVNPIGFQLVGRDLDEARQLYPDGFDYAGEFYGIPFKGHPLSSQIVAPVYETYGPAILVHEYDGPILHGLHHDRALAVEELAKIPAKMLN